MKRGKRSGEIERRKGGKGIDVPPPTTATRSGGQEDESDIGRVGQACSLVREERERDLGPRIGSTFLPPPQLDDLDSSSHSLPPNAPPFTLHNIHSLPFNQSHFPLIISSNPIPLQILPSLLTFRHPDQRRSRKFEMYEFGIGRDCTEINWDWRGGRREMDVIRMA